MPQRFRLAFSSHYKDKYPEAPKLLTTEDLQHGLVLARPQIGL